MKQLEYPKANISAVVLTLGEKTFPRAVDSLYKQSLRPSGIITVKDVSPFHAALNYGADQVKTDFFIQVDSDMILDKDCIMNLISNMTDGVGIVMGQLRDPLMGAEAAVKIFRTDCFRSAKFRDTVSPDTDFYADVLRNGWQIKSALYLTRERNYGEYWYTFGEHLPDYTPVYVFRRYHLIGQRYRYRKSLPMFLWRLNQLSSVNHEFSLIAQVSMCHGIFSVNKTDQLEKGLYSETPEYTQLYNFLYNQVNHNSRNSDVINPELKRPADIFSYYYRKGIDIKSNNEPESFLKYMKMLSGNSIENSWIAKTAISHGILTDSSESGDISNKFNLLMQIIQ